jgi:hypothetical protein
MTNPELQRIVDTGDLRRRHATLSKAAPRCALGCRGRRVHETPAASALVREIPALCDDIDRLRALLMLARHDHQDLVAAARATLNAAAEGEPNPLYYLRDELRARGLLAAERGERPW